MAKKRTKANGEGTLYRKAGDSKWYGQITVGKKEDGKPVRKSVSGKTKAEATDKLNKIRADMGIMDIVKADSYTVSEWIEFYMNTEAKPNLSETSYQLYERLFRIHILPNFGDYYLSQLTTDLIQEVFTKQFQDGELSRSTMNSVKTKLGLTLKLAVKKGIIAKNPCQGVVLHKMREAKSIEALSVENQKKLVDYCYKDQYNYLFIFLLGTGLRIGEALGLTWDYVDMEKKLIKVQKIMIEVSGNPKFKDYPKTENSIRELAVSDKMMKILEAQLQFKNDMNYLNLVFPSSNYNFRTTANLRTKFIKICDAAGIDHINLHGLRHTFATRMLEKDVAPKVVSQMLGHKSIVTTLNIYSHVLKEHQEEHILKIDDFV